MGTQIDMKPPPIKNKGASELQITADQLLLDSQIHRVVQMRPPTQLIMDEQQLAVSKQQKRKEFEDKIRRQRYNLSAWVRYAQWQQGAKQFTRARSIFERALEIEYTNKSLWLRYAQMEMKHKFINHARNVWERATYYLPREDQFWFKYAYMEEIIGEYAKARNIFERWMTWVPGQKAWMSYLKFEQRMGEPENAKKIMYRFLEAFPQLQTYLKVAKFQIKSRNRDAARSIYERVITELGEDAMHQQYFSEFAKFQIKHREYDRAKEIYQFGLKHIPKEKCKKLYNQYLNFEKEHGTKQNIDECILGERRTHYKELLSQNPLNYDAWINLTQLEESSKNVQRARETYEAAIKEIPPAKEKRFWRRYIYLWYNYTIFQEEMAQQLLKANEVYERALALVPHKIFTFSKLWINYAHFHLRCADLQKARKIFGTAIGMCPRQKIFKAYIQMEQQLCQLDRVRAIYEKYLQKFPQVPGPWIAFASFQKNMEQFERAKDILRIGHQMKVEGLPDPDEFIQVEQQ